MALTTIPSELSSVSGISDSSTSTAITINSSQEVTFAGNITTGSNTISGVLSSVTGSLGSAATATTQAASDNTTKIATTAYVTTALANLVDSAPGTLNTLNELAAALGDDANFSTTVTNSIATKLPLAGGTMTGDLILGDNVKIEIGSASGGDLQIYHDSNNSYIDDAGSGSLLIRGTNLQLRSYSTNENFLAATENGAVSLYYDGLVKAATTSTGINVTGSVTVTGDFPKLYFVDTAGSDLDAYIVNNANGLFFGKTNSPSASNDILALDLTNQRVGIGTASPSEILHVIDSNPVVTISSSSVDQLARLELFEQKNGSADLGGFFEYSGASANALLIGTTLNSTDTTHLYLPRDGSGKVGIGTTSPEHSLHVLDSGSTTNGTIKVGGNAASLGVEISYDQTGDTSASIVANPTYTNDDATLKILVDGDRNPNQLLLDGKGNVGIGTTPGAVRLNSLATANGNLAGMFTNTHATGSYGVKVQAGHDSSNYSLALADKDNNTHFYFRGDGNFGIGTTTPDYQLDIENSGNAVARLFAGTNASASLRLQNDAQHWDVNLQTNDKFAIYDHTSGSQPFTIMPTTNNVGIGNATPGHKLDVEAGANQFALARVGSSVSDNSEVTIGYFDATAGNGIPGLIGASDFGGLIQGGEHGHLVFGIRDNDATDAVDIISGGGNFMSDSTYDTKVATFRADGKVGIGASTPDSKLHVYYTSSGTNPLAEAYAGLNLEGSSSVRMLFGTNTASPYAGYIQASNGGSGFPITLNPSGGNVGINETAPDKALHIRGSQATIRIVDNTADRYVDIVNVDARMALRADPSNTTAASYISMEVDGAECARVIAGGGITFNGDSSAANALDDYEEGAWTPTLVGMGATGSFSPSSTANGGFYVKIGRQITAWMNVNGTLSGASGEMNVTGLPYPVATNSAVNGRNALYSTGSLQYWSGSGADVMGPLMTPGSAQIYFHTYNGTSNGGQPSAVNGTHNLHCFVTYYTN